MAWTDDPIIPEQTPVKGVHIDEVRERIDALQADTCPLHDSSALLGDLASHLTGDDGAKYTTHCPGHDIDYHKAWYDLDQASHYMTHEDARQSTEDLGHYTDVNPDHNTPKYSDHRTNEDSTHEGWYNNAVHNVNDSNNDNGVLTGEDTDYCPNHNVPIDNQINAPHNGDIGPPDCSIHQDRWYSQYCPELYVNHYNTARSPYHTTYELDDIGWPPPLQI